eukprot:2497190-Amphidinium_carterae.1
MESEAFGPKGGYPPLEGLPDIPKQERWQDVDDVLNQREKDEVSDEEDFQLSHDLTAGATGSDAQSSRGGTSARGERLWKLPMNGMFTPGIKDRRHMAEHTGPFALSDPESHGL